MPLTPGSILYLARRGDTALGFDDREAALAALRVSAVTDMRAGELFAVEYLRLPGVGDYFYVWQMPDPFQDSVGFPITPARDSAQAETVEFVLDALFLPFVRDTRRTDEVWFRVPLLRGAADAGRTKGAVTGGEDAPVVVGLSRLKEAVGSGRERYATGFYLIRSLGVDADGVCLYRAIGLQEAVSPGFVRVSRHLCRRGVWAEEALPGAAEGCGPGGGRL